MIIYIEKISESSEYSKHSGHHGHLAHQSYIAMREDGISKSELARRMSIDEKEVRRMLDPRHPSKHQAWKERYLVSVGRLLRNFQRRLSSRIEHKLKIEPAVNP